MAVSIGTNGGTTKAMERIDDLLVHGKLNEIDRALHAQLPTNRIAAAVASSFGACGPATVFSTACSAGNYAIGHGYDLIRRGKADVVLAGASDAFSRIAFTGFNQFKAVAPDRCQPFDRNRKGMMVAEGAAFMVLETLGRAEERSAPIYGEVAGYGLSCDAHHMTASDVHGIVACMESALRSSNLSTSAIDYISAHGTGTLTNDRNECTAIWQLFGERTKKIPVSSIKSMLGHTMGAASALEAIACALAVKYDMVPPTMNYETADPDCNIDCVPNQARKHRVAVALNNSYAFGGNNASLVIKKFEA
jgi:3-oxoacyl-[acyl-carrier-protein] synthase II